MKEMSEQECALAIAIQVLEKDGGYPDALHVLKSMLKSKSYERYLLSQYFDDISDPDPSSDN
jgi:hypothetical protein